MPILESIATNLFSSFLFSKIENEYNQKSPFLKKLKLWYLLKTRHKEQEIRLSIAYLYKIKIDDKYLLVKGKRIDQYQPIGGVYKRYSSSDKLFKKLNVLDDNRIPIDEKSRMDLRIRVKGRNAIKLIGWFFSREDRETQQWREFYEELVEPGFLSKANFPFVDIEHLYTIQHPLKWSNYFACYEILIHEYYELKPNIEQEKELRGLMQANNSQDFVWVDERIIKSLGRDNINKQKPFSIAETALYLISND